jgi:glutaredoxin
MIRKLLLNGIRVSKKYRKQIRKIGVTCFGDIFNVSFHKYEWYILLENDEILAFASLNKKDNMLWNVCVNQYIRGKGIGQKLMKFVIDNNSYKDITLHVNRDGNDDRRINFYKKFNFKVIKTLPSYFVLKRTKSYNNKNIKSSFVIFGRSFCPYCNKARNMIDSGIINGIYIDMSTLNEDQLQKITQFSNYIPIIFRRNIKNTRLEYIGGLRELEEELN